MNTHTHVCWILFCLQVTFITSQLSISQTHTYNSAILYRWCVLEGGELHTMGRFQNATQAGNHWRTSKPNLSSLVLASPSVAARFLSIDLCVLVFDHSPVQTRLINIKAQRLNAFSIVLVKMKDASLCPPLYTLAILLMNVVEYLYSSVPECWCLSNINITRMACVRTRVSCSNEYTVIETRIDSTLMAVKA